MNEYSPEALYIHIPFCSSICTYCDFYKLIAKGERKQKYISHLVKEAEMKKSYFSALKTIFIGGGTPTSLPFNLFDFLLTNLQRLIDFNKIEEFTVEANPNDITPELAELLKTNGVNRISLGIQSFDPEKLESLGRKHTEHDVKKAFSLLRKYGFTNINADIIYGLKGDNFKKVKNDLKKAINYGATHISAYSLILEEKTILMKLHNEGKFERMDEDEEAKLYQNLTSYLKKRGFIHYEISNFSRKNLQCKHNLTYWNNMNYIGIGANSSYYLGNTRYTNINNIDLYCEGIASGTPLYREANVLALEEQMSEEMILGLRKTEGINLTVFREKYGIDAIDAFPIIRNLINLKLLAVKNDNLYIPEKSLYLSNEVLINFI
ncbi:MAG TPA: radical SAM family heme chaperone HemW [Acholeplasmataceae bacterium]|nr:radical SAM family heme chaperone HemW [Acholeplasmataceae bacterium]